LNMLPGVPCDEITMQVLIPDFRRHDFVDLEKINKLAETFQANISSLNPDNLSKFSQRCWIEIMSKHSYQVPSYGRAEILVSDRLYDLLNLDSIRFIQEGANAMLHEVFLAFIFRGSPRLGIVKVKSDGSTEGFHELGAHLMVKFVIESIAIAYYRDLVVPGEVYYYSPRNIQAIRPRHESKSKQKKSKKPRSLPRRQTILESAYSLSNWYYVQERARHDVVGHRRWVDRNFVAEGEKQLQARRAGVYLPQGFTWVIEHERGGHKSGGLILNGFDLVERTIFSPPSRATHELAELYL
jgi:hypothetical protein